MGKKSASAPDVVGAATTEGEFSRETARDKTYADRPDQFGALGSTTWSQELVTDPATGERTTKWTQNENLNPNLNRAAVQGSREVGRSSDLSQNLMGRVEQEMNAPIEWAQFGQGRAGPESRGVIGETEMGSDNRQRAEDDAYGRSTQRLDPQFENDRNQLEIRLRNRGLSAGDQQYQAEMDSFNTGRNDAYEMARMGATSEGRTEDSQSFNQMLSGNQNNRQADQQFYDQSTQSTANANALRDQQIQEYINKRGFSLGEQQNLDATGQAGRLAAAYAGGDSGGSDS
jgi:hypothetical protein